MACVAVGIATVIAAPPAPAGDPPKPSGRLTAAEIDAALAAKWTAAGLTPSAPAPDVEFLRRVTLDLTGTIPSLEAAEAFMADANPEKRAVLVDTLLASPAFVEYWSAVLERTLVGRLDRGQRFDRRTFREFLQKSLTEGHGYDRIVRDMLLAEGDTADVGATGYLLRYEAKPPDVAGQVAKTLLGVQIQCAQCHNHPYEKWTTTDFKQFAAFFGATYMKPVQGPDPKDPKQMKRISWELQEVGPGEDAPGPYGKMGGMGGMGTGPGAERRKKKMLERAEKNPEIKERLEAFMTEPRPIGATKATALEGRSRREALADWMTSPSNAYFAKAAANRLWAMCFGRGIVHPVDDFSPKNAPTHPELLDRLAAELQANGYDLRALLRLLVSTKAYALSSKPSADNEGDTTAMSRASVRALSAEQIFASVFQATEAQKGMPMLGERAKFMERVRDLILQGFILTFDNDEGDSADAFEGSIPQALAMLNSALTNAQAAPGGGGLPLPAGLKPLPGTTIGRILHGPGDAKAKIGRIYLAVLVRQPTEAEMARCLRYLEESGGGIAAYQDLFWALLNTTEFIVTR